MTGLRGDQVAELLGRKPVRKRYTFGASHPLMPN
jgi:hypothetical protein